MKSLMASAQDDTIWQAGYPRRRRPRWGLILVIAALHVLAMFGLARAFAPDFTASVIDEATSLVTVTVRTVEQPEPEVQPSPEPEPDEGRAGDEGREAVAREVLAPEPPIRIPNPSPAPRATSTGSANTSGARDQGTGTGAGGSGDGTGAGRGGNGRGGIPVTKPVKIAGDIRSARDYPVPPGGRETRFGQQVIVYMTVGVDGRASNCRVAEASNDPVADRITCDLAVERFRFEPARDANGAPVAAEYGWRQQWCRGSC